MNMTVLKALVDFIEGFFKQTAPLVFEAAETSAPELAALASGSDPQAQAIAVASVALLQAAQKLKAAIDAKKDAAA